MPFGASVLPDGRVRFRLLAPTARQVELLLKNGAENEIALLMCPIADGWFQIETSPQ